MSNTTFLIQTERLNIVHAEENDAEFVLKLFRDPDVLRYIGDKGIHNVDNAKSHIREKFIQSYQDFGYGLFVVRLRKNGEPVGMCGLINRPSLPHVDIGYAFTEDSRGNGYAIEAARAVMSYAKNTCGLEKVIAVTSLDNETSEKLLNKLGLFHTNIIEADGLTSKLFEPNG